MTILDAATAAAVSAAATQTEQIAALIAPWAGGNVTARVMNGSTLLSTLTHVPWIVNGGANPRSAAMGARISRVFAASGTPNRVVFRVGTTDIFELTAAIGSGDVSFAASIQTMRRERIVGVTITATASLPLAPPAPPPPPPPPPPAPSITLSSTGNPVAGTEYNVTVTAANLTGALVVTPENVSGTATFNPSTATPAPGELVKLFGATWAAAGAASIRATAAGGVVSNTLSVTVAPAPSPPPPPPPAPTPGTTLTTLTLVGTDGAAKPFTAGMAFAKGHVPAANQIVLTGASVTAQAHVKNSWPDGSVKFAILAGRATVSGGTAALAVSAGTQTLGAALDLTALQATGITASVTAGTFGSAVWTNGDFASPFHTWVSGPEMSSWVYRKQIGSDAHLVAWLRVRLFADGRVAVRAWAENGFVNVASPSNKSDVYTFTLSGTERYSSVTALDLKHHQRAVLLSGADLEHWIGTDPGVTVLHDRAYLQATELVPSVFANMAAGAAEVTRLPSTFTPLEQGVFDYGSDSMASTGYQRPIGPLPSHEVIYLTCHASDQATMARVVDRGGLNAGRYGIHYRDEATNRPLRFSDHPTRVIADGQGFKDNGSSTTGTRTPVATGGNPPQWDTAHSPAVGYMAYLLTGDWYHMETALFAATCNYLGNGDNSLLRTGAQGLVQTAVNAWQTRACAWDWRSKIMALTVVPDADPAPGGSGNTLRQELANCVESNIAHFHGRYVAQANNEFGLILPGETYGTAPGVLDEIAIWQQHFVTAMFGWSVCMDLPIGATPKSNLAAFFQWKAKSSVQTLGTSSEFWYINASAYTVKLGGSPRSQSAWTAGTGPWPANAAALYAATITPSAPAWFGSTDGTLAGEFLPDYTAACTSMQGNMMPALAYAVRLAVPGASAAYNRLTAATNWSNYVSAFNARPTWAHKPLVDPVATPAWLLGTPTYQWVDMGAASVPNVPLNAWGTLPLIDGTGTLVSPANGGHTDSADNRVSSIDVLQAAPSWTQRIAPSASFTSNVAYMPDGKPVSRHGYHHAHYIAQRGRVMLFAAEGVYESGGWTGKVDGIRVSDWTWDCVTGAATYPALEPFGRGYGIGRDPRTGNVWTGSGWLWDQAANTWSQPGTQQINGSGLRNPFVFDALRNQFFCLQWGNGRGFDGVLRANVIHPVTGAVTAITFSAGSAAAVAQFTADKPTYMGGDYDPINDNFVFYAGQANTDGGGVASLQPNRLFRVTPNGTSVWDMDLMTVAGTPDTVPSGGAGVNGRLRYVAAIKGFVLFPRQDARGWAFKTAT